jgi:RNA-binding protein
MQLKPKQKRYLRSLSHHRKPLVIIGGAGLTQAVLDEIDSTIAHHELIKIRINASDKAQRQSMIDEISTKLNCTLVFSIGHVATFYRPGKKRLIELPMS